MKKITLTAIANELTNKGFDATVTTVNKNGTNKDAINIRRSENLGVVFYPEITESSTLDDVVNHLINEYNTAPTPTVDVLSDPSYILNNVYVGLEGSFDANYIKRPSELYHGLYEYMYVKVNINGDSGTVKVNEQLLDFAGWGIDEEFWNVAYENTRKNALVQNLADVVGFPMPVDMWVISNTDRLKGAGVITCKDVMNDVCKQLNTEKVIIIPSSIHECIAVPYTNPDDVTAICGMITEVNATELDPTEILADHPFMYEVA